MLLQSHPKYAEWSAAYPEGVPGLSKGMFVAMAASLWPDDIRDKNNPETHPEWHYVDYAVKPPAFPMEPAPHPTNDILYGIQQCEVTVRSAAEASRLRAEMASWMMHLVGDIHQPLHCAALINADFPAPDGDRGGNGAFIKADKEAQVINLHMFWDSQLGGARVADAASAREALHKAILLEAQHPRPTLPELVTSPTPKDWSLEGRKIAIEEVYLRGALKYSLSKLNAPVLPEGYSKKAKTIAERRVALAAYRLADAFKRLLDTPSLPAGS